MPGLVPWTTADTVEQVLQCPLLGHHLSNVDLAASQRSAVSAIPGGFYLDVVMENQQKTKAVKDGKSIINHL
jgi:hypothetical protein